MTQARKTRVDPAHAASFHCVARCVWRAWLCGFDDYLGKSFEHRKPWVERRILEVAVSLFLPLAGRWLDRACRLS